MASALFDLDANEETPETFTPANAEKRAALNQFQPHGVLVSRGTERARRREVNENALDTGRPVHADAEAIVGAVHTELAPLLDHLGDELDFDNAHQAWRRTVRRFEGRCAARADRFSSVQRWRR